MLELECRLNLRAGWNYCGQRRALIPIPFPVASLMGTVAGWSRVVMAPPLTADQVELLKADNVVSGQHPGLAELGITPTTLDAILPTYLYSFRRGGQYADQEARAAGA